MSTVFIQNLRKRYTDVDVLPAFNLEVSDGECVALLGPSGCGKTTVLRCLAGLESADEGTVAIGGRTVDDPRRGVHVPVQRRNLGLVFQNYALWPHMTVFENVAYPLRMKRLRSSVVREEVHRHLQLVGLDGYAERPSMDLSGGQQQRVALARALVASPSVLLLDEPLSNLDAQLRRQLRTELRRIRSEVRTTTVYVTHDQTEALTLADRIFVLNRGRIEQADSPHAVFTRPASRFVAEFLGFENFLDGTVTRVHGEAVTVRSADWDGEIVTSTRHRLSTGDTVQIAVRASSVQIQPSPDELGHHPTTITDTAYLGDSYEYRVQRLGATILSRNAANRPLQPGTHVRLDITPDDAVVLTR